MKEGLVHATQRSGPHQQVKMVKVPKCIHDAFDAIPQLPERFHDSPGINVSMIDMMSVVLTWDCSRKAMETREC